MVASEKIYKKYLAFKEDNKNLKTESVEREKIYTENFDLKKVIESLNLDKSRLKAEIKNLNLEITNAKNSQEILSFTRKNSTVNSSNFYV
jgi:hypothetical protein